ncbi:hypothetical protein [Psychrobacter sp. BF1]|uniref:hypothetical protein n=1 Tax=Psychrobacter sp. BF1 TaxID=2821147 RepID=UPI001C4DF46E|nr:hypothetical protein [Psychrobacter sp. BF1]
MSDSGKRFTLKVLTSTTQLQTDVVETDARCGFTPAETTTDVILFLGCGIDNIFGD